MAEDLKGQQEIRSSLKSIVETADNSLGRLRKRQYRLRLATSFLTTFLVILLAGGLGFVAVRFGGISPYYIGVAAILATVTSALATYYLLKRNHEAQLKELTLLLAQMKNKIAQENQQRPVVVSGEGIAGDVLSLADKILKVLPQLLRKRNQDSLLYGIIAFVLASIIGENAAVGILVGVMVWLYFRYEIGKNYDREIAKFEEQKRVFEQRQKDFLETL